MEAWRRSVNAHYSFGSIGSSLSNDFQVYISKCQDPYVSPSCTIFFSTVLFPCFSMLILSLSIKGMGSASASFSPGFCVSRARQQDTIFREQNLISWFFTFFLLSVLVNGINKFGWLPCTRQGMLTQGLAPNPTGKLNISSVITPPHL